MPYDHKGPQNRRDSRSGLDTAEALVAAGVDLPDEIAAAMELYAALTARARALPSQTDARRATLDALLSSPNGSITKPIRAELDRDVEANAVQQATAETAAHITALVARPPTICSGGYVTGSSHRPLSP